MGVSVFGYVVGHLVVAGVLVTNSSANFWVWWAHTHLVSWCTVRHMLLFCIQGSECLVAAAATAVWQATLTVVGLFQRMF